MSESFTWERACTIALTAMGAGVGLTYGVRSEVSHAISTQSVDTTHMANGSISSSLKGSKLGYEFSLLVCDDEETGKGTIPDIIIDGYQKNSPTR